MQLQLRRIIGFPFGNTSVEIGFPILFQAFRINGENLSVSKNLTFTGCPVGNPCQKIGFPTMFLGVPETWKLSNFTPCITEHAIILLEKILLVQQKSVVLYSSHTSIPRIPYVWTSRTSSISMSSFVCVLLRTLYARDVSFSSSCKIKKDIHIPWLL